MSAVDQILKRIAQLEPEAQIELTSQLLARLEKEGRWPPRGRSQGSADLVLLFDGGSQGNPGPGYGSFCLSFRDGRQVRRRLDFGQSMTNNEAEYATLIAGLEEVHRLLREELSQIALEVRGDSQLVGRQIQGQWKTREPRLLSLREQARKLLYPFRSWSYVKVPRQEVVRRLGH